MLFSLIIYYNLNLHQQPQSFKKIGELEQLF